jgi:hypothetical protein
MRSLNMAGMVCSFRTLVTTIQQWRKFGRKLVQHGGNNYPVEKA